MSLDVYLTMKGVVRQETGSGIFVRENGSTKEISRSEWDEKFPGREPVSANVRSDDSTVFDRNITHNLGAMADTAGLHDCVWRPDENGISKASQLIEPLRSGLTLLQSDPEKFKKLNPENGWGDYDGLVEFIREYLEACEEYPEAEVRVSR